MATDFLLSVATAASAGCIADFATFPLDTAKVRLQIQGSTQALMTLATHEGAVGVRMNIPQYNGLFGTITTIARQEGPKALYNGLSAGLQRQMCFASVRLGFYEPTKKFYQDLFDNGDRKVKKESSLNIGTRILAGLTTGGMAVLLAQPTDVVKVRYQASIGGNGHRYASTLDAYRTIARSEGLFGLWRGLLPNVSRNAIINVAEIVCYDVVKDTLLMYRVMQDGIPLHFSSAVIAGFCATVVASPVDVVKTRYMNAKPGEYKGAIDCTTRMFAQEGLHAFYRGFTPSVCRLVSWNIVMWMTYEQIREAVVRYRTQVQAGPGF